MWGKSIYDIYVSLIHVHVSLSMVRGIYVVVIGLCVPEVHHVVVQSTCIYICTCIPPSFLPQGMTLEKKEARAEKEEAEKYQKLQQELV